MGKNVTQLRVITYLFYIRLTVYFIQYASCYQTFIKWLFIR